MASIIYYPDPRLKKVSTPVEDMGIVSEALPEMLRLMKEAGGVGLAAPQIGIPLRFFITHDKVYINPKIIMQNGERFYLEGCLSFPGVTIQTRRAKEVTIEAQDVNGCIFTETAQNEKAQLFQHEVNHLNGKLLTDHMKEVSRIANKIELRKLKDQFSSRRLCNLSTTPLISILISSARSSGLNDGSIIS